MKSILGLAKTLPGSGARTLPPFFYSLLLLAHLPLASGQDVTCVFVSPSPQPIAGSQAIVCLYCMNTSSNEVHRTFEPRLNCKLIAGLTTFDTVLVLNPTNSGTEAVIPPGGFVRKEYVLDVPPTIQGQATLDVNTYNPLVIFVQGGPTKPAEAASTPPTPPAISAPSSSPIMQFLTNHLSPYEPIYFIVGSYPAAEFQLSLKYQIFSFTNTLHSLTNVYFAYTQTSFWDLLSSDPSFYDTSYKPSLFYYCPDILHSESDKAIELDLQIGGEHESNGRGGNGERSLNTIYLQPAISFGQRTNLQLTLQPRAWFYASLGNNNPDLADYRGYADLLATLTRQGAQRWENFQFATKFRMGDDGGHTGLQFDLRFDLLSCVGFNPTIQVQYFTGYGQTLRQYNQYSHGLRAGLCLWY